MADGSSPDVELRDVVIVGGGCYGTFYARQLLHAAERGKLSYRTILVVDRDPGCRFTHEIGQSEHCRLVVENWTEFFDDYLGGGAAPDDAIVPSPLMPHLMYEWLVRRARARWPGRLIETRPLPWGPGTPYDVEAPDGTRYVSYADWICPTHCIEPATCPMIRAPRTWEMSEALEGLTARLGATRAAAGPVVFVCKHRVYGVGMFDVSAVLAGDQAVASAGRGEVPVDVLVGTISSCHGAVNLLHLG
ncbi:MAG TPA: hypothetical protein VD930_01260 [Gemmatimonadales bacterium]|nr:hypothetical protein [Gemmatimonadales bacterium]